MVLIKSLTLITSLLFPITEYTKSKKEETAIIGVEHDRLG